MSKDREATPYHFGKIKQTNKNKLAKSLDLSKMKSETKKRVQSV